MSFRQRLQKGLRLLAQPKLLNALFRYRVAAAVEHREAIRYAAPATLLDVGANKGQFTLAFLSVNPEGTVIAFEPLGGAIKYFERIFVRDCNVFLHKYALSEVNGTCRAAADRPLARSATAL